MTSVFSQTAELAARQHGGVSTRQLDEIGVDRFLRAKWVTRHRLGRAGPHSYVVAGSPDTPLRSAWCAAADIEGRGVIAGRTAAWLLRLDGFLPPGPIEVLLGREHRGARLPHVLRTSVSPIEARDTTVVSGIRCLRAARLIAESPHFGFTAAETENAIDSAIRRRLVGDGYLRDRVLDTVGQGVRGGVALRDALVDAGGESRLERWFLTLVRKGEIPRPAMRVVVRAHGDFSARLDARFPGGLVVELEGHATHSSRRQRQHDEERRTELSLLGYRVIVFTYSDIRDRPDWVLDRLRAALALVA